MAMLDVTVVNVGLGDIQPEFTSPLSTLVWIVDAYTKEDRSAFEDLVGELRVTEEWEFVDRGVDIRVVWTE